MQQIVTPSRELWTPERARRREIARAAPLFAFGGGIMPARKPATGAVFDPATLSLGLWTRASYSGSPWVGTASAGSSGTHDLTEATNTPQTGTAVNGYTPAKFDPGVANHKLTNASDFRATFMTTTALTFVALVNMVSLGADNASPFAEEAIILDSGGWASLNITTSGVRLYVWDTAAKASPYTAVSTGTWTMVVGKLDGGNLYSKINGAAWSSGNACGTAGIPASQTLLCGCNSAINQFMEASVLEIMAAPSVISDANLDNIRSYFNSRYALSL